MKIPRNKNWIVIRKLWNTSAKNQYKFVYIYITENINEGTIKIKNSRNLKPMSSVQIFIDKKHES